MCSDESDTHTAQHFLLKCLRRKPLSSAPELRVMNSEFILCEDAKKVLIFIIKEEFKGQQSGWSCRDFKS